MNENMNKQGWMSKRGCRIQFFMVTACYPRVNVSSMGLKMAA